MRTPETSVDEDARDNSVNLTPMLDVVFILLIFFIVTATFVRETGIDVNKPEANPADIVENATILVAITDNNEIWIDRRMIDPRRVRANIERLRAKHPDGMVVIRADKKSHNMTLVQVMDAARQAGIYNITMAADPD